MKILDTILWGYMPSNIGDYAKEAAEQVEKDKAKILDLLKEAFEAGRKASYKDFTEYLQSHLQNDYLKTKL